MRFDLSCIKLFAFDFDGTLMHSNHIKYQAFIDVVSKETDKDEAIISVIQSIVTDNSHLDRYGIFAKLAQSYTELNPDKLARLYGAQCEHLILKAETVSGAFELLKAIKQKGARAIINTATPQTAMQEIADQLSFVSDLGGVYGAPNTKAENLEIAMDKFKVTPEETVMVGDRENDRIAAEQIKCHFIGIKSDISDYIKTPETLYDDLNPVLKLMSKQETENV